jgi:hypothetical protein
MGKFQNVNFEKPVVLKVADKCNNKNIVLQHRPWRLKIMQQRQYFRLTYKLIWVGLQSDVVLFLVANCYLILIKCMFCIFGGQFYPLQVVTNWENLKISLIFYLFWPSGQSWPKSLQTMHIFGIGEQFATRKSSISLCRLT